MIYLDNAATTKPYTEVLERMSDVSERLYANPQSRHTFGMQAEIELNSARSVIAEALRVSVQELYFSSGGTESINTVVHGIAELSSRLGNHILATSVEHQAVLKPLEKLSKRGFEVELLPVDERGCLDLDYAISRVRETTRFLSIMHVNNENGAIFDTAEVSRRAKRKNPDLLLHVDAVQSFCKLELFPREMGVDFVSVAAHKLHGPKGIGALYVRKGVNIGPLILGGGQENGLRSGTQNLPAICGFAEAVSKRNALRKAELAHVKGLKSELAKELEVLFENRVRILSGKDTTPYILTVAFEKIKSEVMLHHLAEKGIYVSSGSACSSKKSLRSHVIRAMKLAEEWQDGVIRFSFCGANTQDEIRQVLKASSSIYSTIRQK